jgi:septal ring factor EnvC (AmiA/AmiB activator)
MTAIKFRDRVTTAGQLADEVRELSDRDGNVMRERASAHSLEARRLNDEARARREARAAERQREMDAERERERQAAEADLCEQHRAAFLTANAEATSADFDRLWPSIHDELMRVRSAHSHEMVVQSALDTGAYTGLV